MAVDRYLIGSDGTVIISLGASSALTAQTTFKVNSYAATLSRFEADHTSFGDTGKRIRLGMLDLQGTLNCIVGVSNTATATATSIFTSTQEGTNRPTLSLSLYEQTSTSDAKIVSSTAFSSFAFNSNAAGEMTCTVNFKNADGVAPVVTWLSEA
jgi:hypothetical protein